MHHSSSEPHQHLDPADLAVALDRLLVPGADVGAFLDDLWQCPTCRRAAIRLEGALAWLQLDEPLAFDELASGEARYDELMAVGPARRRELIDGYDTGPVYGSWGVAWVLLAQVHVVRDVDRARELAELLLYVAWRLDVGTYGESQVADMGARAYAARADVERRGGDLRAAEASMVQARLAARQGTGRATPFLDAVEADLLDALDRPGQAEALRRPGDHFWATLAGIRHRLEARLETARASSTGAT